MLVSACPLPQRDQTEKQLSLFSFFLSLPLSYVHTRVLADRKQHVQTEATPWQCESKTTTFLITMLRKLVVCESYVVHTIELSFHQYSSGIVCI